MTMDEAGDDVSSSSTGEGDSLVMGVQEWKWYLEDLGLLPEQDAKNQKEDSPTHQRPVSSLPADAAIHQINETIESGGIQQSLSLLHRIHTYGAPTVKHCLSKAQSHRDAEQAKLELGKNRHKQARADCQDQSRKLGLAADLDIIISSGDLSTYVNDWVENELRPQCLELAKDIVCSNLQALQPIVDYHAAFCERIKHQGEALLPVLSRLSEETELDFGTVENIILELTMLENFLKGRLLDSTKPITTMAFMTQITPEDDDIKSQLRQYTKTVQNMLTKLSTGPLVPWTLLEGNSSVAIKQLEIGRNRIVESEARVKQAESRLAVIELKVQSLQEDLERCLEHVEHLRQQLETDICDLLEDESRVVQIRLR